VELRECLYRPRAWKNVDMVFSFNLDCVSVVRPPVSNSLNAEPTYYRQT
jgi:hypothetical protein